MKAAAANPSSRSGPLIFGLCHPPLSIPIIKTWSPN